VLGAGGGGTWCDCPFPSPAAGCQDDAEGRGDAAGSPIDMAAQAGRRFCRSRGSPWPGRVGRCAAGGGAEGTACGRDDDGGRVMQVSVMEQRCMSPRAPDGCNVRVGEMQLVRGRGEEKLGLSLAVPCHASFLLLQAMSSRLICVVTSMLSSGNGIARGIECVLVVPPFPFPLQMPQLHQRPYLDLEVSARITSGGSTGSS
jgi:hypothetical protein